MLYSVQLQWVETPRLIYEWVPNVSIMDAFSTAMAKVWPKDKEEGK